MVEEIDTTVMKFVQEHWKILVEVIVMVFVLAPFIRIKKKTRGHWFDE